MNNKGIDMKEPTLTNIVIFSIKLTYHMSMWLMVYRIWNLT